MRLLLPPGPLKGEIDLPISKSIANRYLMIAALVNRSVTLNLFQGLRSEMLKRVQHGGTYNFPQDIHALQEALRSNADEINIGMAGTAMRFLTAYFVIQEGRTVILTGDARMKHRPISELVDALRMLGADIDYSEKEGFPPLKITGKKLKGCEVEISASVSSQFISALMMIGPMMENGLHIRLNGKILSKPYMELTADCMRNCGVDVTIEDNAISIPHAHYQVPNLEVEADWTSASYFYAMAATRPHSKFLLNGLSLQSPQGDAVVADWFGKMGVASVQKESGVEITSSEELDFPSELDFIDYPDLAQTFAFLAATLGKTLQLTGLYNLRLKETDRVAALKTELEKLGVSVLIAENTMTISGTISAKEATICTYNDHRMAMGAAALSVQGPITIENPEVVAKSFPGFWKALEF